MRNCDSCGRKLPGRRRHGFVSPSGSSVRCGRSAVQRTVQTPGGPQIQTVETPRCASKS